MLWPSHVFYVSPSEGPTLWLSHGMFVVNAEEMAGAGTDEHEQRGEESGTVVSGPGLVEAGKGMATEVSDSLVSVRGRMMEKLSGLQLPSESLEAVRRTFETGLKGAYTTTRDAVQRTKQSLLDLFPSSHTSSSATEARKVHCPLPGDPIPSVVSKLIKPEMPNLIYKKSWYNFNLIFIAKLFNLCGCI